MQLHMYFVNDANPFHWYGVGARYQQLIIRNFGIERILYLSFVLSLCSIVPQVSRNNSDNVDYNYDIIMTTITIIIHTLYEYTVPKHFRVVHATVYFFSLFPRFVTDRAIWACYTTAVDNARHFPRSGDFSWNYFFKIQHVCMDVWYTYTLLLLLFPIVVVLFVAFSWLCCAFCCRLSLVVLLPAHYTTILYYYWCIIYV